MDLDRACPHEDFEVTAEVNRLLDDGQEPPIGYSVDLRVRCVQCDEPFRWTGLKAGLSSAHPMVDPTEQELRAPIRPASSDPDFGLGIPGFSIGIIESE